MNDLRVGLVGAGSITRVHLPAWLDLGADVVVHALEGADELTSRFGGEVVGSFDELLDRCDIVDVCTPTPLHRPHAEAALEAGKNVVAEKPLARTHDDAAHLAELAAGNGNQLYPAHVVRYYPQYARMAAAVSVGQVGRPAVLRFTRTGSFPRWSDWFADHALSGGVVMDLMVHDLDIARWVAGEVREVYATLARGAGDDGHDVTTAHVVLTHVGGAISHVRGVWGPPGTTFATTFSVAGDEGVLTWDSADAAALRLDVGRRTTGGEVRPSTALMESPYLTELREFSEAFAGGPPPRVSAVDGVIAVDLALAALESIESGQPVAFTTWAVRA
jgi:myo-inositol 2-dehydrogenase/D-chiro-inositol 1-dehydrogenase